MNGIMNKRDREYGSDRSLKVMGSHSKREGVVKVEAEILSRCAL